MEGSAATPLLETVKYFEEMNNIAKKSGFQNAQEMLASQKEMMSLMAAATVPAPAPYFQPPPPPHGFGYGPDMTGYVVVFSILWHHLSLELRAHTVVDSDVGADMVIKAEAIIQGEGATEAGQVSGGLQRARRPLRRPFPLAARQMGPPYHQQKQQQYQDRQQRHLKAKPV